MYSDEKINNELERISKEYDEAPTWREIENNGEITPETICARLDKDWTELLSEMNFEHDRASLNGEVFWEEESDFISAVKQYCSDIDEPPMLIQVRNDLQSFPNYSDRWGITWKDVLLKAGYSEDEIPFKHRTREERKEKIYQDVKEFVSETEGWPKKGDFYSEYDYNHSVYNYFDSWKRLVCSFGVPLEMVSDFKYIYENIDNPTLEDFEDYSDFTVARLYNEFDNIETISEIVDVEWWSEGRDRYYGPSWREQREKAWERDNYSCRICGKVEQELGRKPHVHHIKPKREWDVQREHEEMNSLNNLICLCPSHHSKLEGKWQDSTPEDFKKRAKRLFGTFHQTGERSVFNY